MYVCMYAGSDTLQSVHVITAEDIELRRLVQSPHVSHLYRSST